MYADYKVIFAKESNLPYSLSPSKYDNSPSKYDNSISKYDNSESKYGNSESKYDNSPSKYDNSSAGKNRLLLERDGRLVYIGYYVWGEGGICNLFSSKGKRLYYSPTGTDAIFGNKNGEFCGTFAEVESEKVLILTEKGQVILMSTGLAPTSEKTNPKESTSKIPSSSSGHWIKENIEQGTTIILEDGSIWLIDPMDKTDAMLWLPVTEITVIKSDDGSLGYNYLLINIDDEEQAHAKYLGKQ